MKTIILMAFFAALPIAVMADSESVPVLAFNPFERPGWISDAQEIPAAEHSAKPRQRLDLRATLSAGKKSSANVGGRIIAIGEEVDGYTLIAVAEGVAEFSDGDQIIRIALLRGEGETNAD